MKLSAGRHLYPIVWLKRLVDALAQPMDASGPITSAPPPLLPPALTLAPCPRCGHAAPKVAVTPSGCPQCFNTPLPWTGITRLADFRGPIVGAIHAMKYNGRWPLAKRLGRKLALRIKRKNIIHPQTLVTPVPMHWARRLTRGYNHAHILAQSVADTLSLPCLPLLKRTRNNPAQVGLSRTKRKENLKGVIAPLPIDLTGRNILLIDDVTTTGATLEACARALKKAGAANIHVGVIAVVFSKP